MKYVFECGFSGYIRGHKTVTVEANSEEKAFSLLRDFEFEVVDVCTIRDDTEMDFEFVELVEVK